MIVWFRSVIVSLSSSLNTEVMTPAWPVQSYVGIDKEEKCKYS